MPDTTRFYAFTWAESQSERMFLPAGKLPQFSESQLKILLMAANSLTGMWIDDSSVDVIKVDFEALYHGDFLVEGDTSEQLDDWHPLAPAV
jgi:hypothetical protein